MKKRVFCNLLVLVLLLGMLPTAALAGGGSEVVWSDDFQASDTWEDWTVIDANGDEYGFSRASATATSGGGGCTFLYYAASPVAIGDNSGTGASSDDYLISQVIDLANAYDEYELTFDCRCIRPEEDDTMLYTLFEVFVIDAGTPLTVESLRSLPVRRFTSEAPHEDRGWIGFRYDLSAYAGRQIRLVFHHKDDSANRLELDNFTITDYEPDQHIDRITVLNVLDPEVGKGVPDAKEEDIRILNSVYLELVPGTLTYLKTVSESGIPQTGDFEDGAEYSIRFDLKPKEGAFTYADAIASVNGRRATLLRNDNGTPDIYEDDVFTIYYYFGYLEKQTRAIEKGSVSLIPPVAGKTPSFDAQPDQDSFTVTSVAWFELNDDAEEVAVLAAGDHFESGKTYRCILDLKPCDGYYFPEEPEMRINDEALYLYQPAISNDKYCRDFEAAESDECLIRFCTDAGTVPEDRACTVGQRIDLPTLEDQPDRRFAGWATDPRAGADALVPESYFVSQSRTLYAVWLDFISAPEVGICTYGPGSDASHTVVVIDPYAKFSNEEMAENESIVWWTDIAEAGQLDKRFLGQFEGGVTYYGLVTLRAEERHCFAPDAGEHLKLSGAVLDESSVDVDTMKLLFHVDMPGAQTIDAVHLVAPTLIPGSYKNKSSDIGIYSVTPGVQADVNTGLWENPGDVEDYTAAYEGSLRPGKTYYGKLLLRAKGDVSIDEKIKITVDGASVISQEKIDAPNVVSVIYSIRILDTYGFTALVRSTDGSYPCGFIRADFYHRWETFFDFAFVPGGDHWIKAMAEPGYTFVEWQTSEGETISTNNPYFFCLDNNAWNIRAVFTPGSGAQSVDKAVLASLIADAENELKNNKDQYTDASVAALETALEAAKTAMTDSDATQDEVNAAAQAVKNAIAGLKEKEAPQEEVHKEELEYYLGVADDLDRDQFTPETVAGLDSAVEAAKAVQENPAATQEEVNAAVDALKDALGAMKLKPAEPPAEPADKSELGQTLADASVIEKGEYTEASVKALEEAIAKAKAVQENATATQEEVNAAAQALKEAIAGLKDKEPETPGKDDKFRFDDVKNKKAFYFEPVYWAYNAKPQITNGVDKSHFGPLEGCTRGQVVTFLWRAAGCPAPKNTKTAFKDVGEKAFYAKAVAWAVEKGITKGMSATSFAPDATCTRGQIGTAPWRDRE